MEVITSYRAFDGKTFGTEKECLEYEEEKTREEKVYENELFKKAIELRNYCSARSCDKCVFCYAKTGNCALGDAPISWDV